MSERYAGLIKESRLAARRGTFGRGDILALCDALEASEREVGDLEQSNIVPRSRYEAGDRDWTETRQELARVRQVATEEIERLEQRLTTLKASCGSDAVEDYIRSLKWTELATEDEKALVAGNLRTFARHLEHQIVKLNKQ